MQHLNAFLFLLYIIYAYRLSNGQHIQMMTALILQLIQCIVTSQKSCGCEASSEVQEDEQTEKKVRIGTVLTQDTSYYYNTLVFVNVYFVSSNNNL